MKKTWHLNCTNCTLLRHLSARNGEAGVTHTCEKLEERLDHASTNKTAIGGERVGCRQIGKEKVDPGPLPATNAIVVARARSCHWEHGDCGGAQNNGGTAVPRPQQRLFLMHVRPIDRTSVFTAVLEDVYKLGCSLL